MSRGAGFTVAACTECGCEPNSYHYPGCSGAPYVCPGCYAVGGRCAPGCIDAEIEREHQEAIEHGHYDAPWEEQAEWEYAP